MKSTVLAALCLPIVCLANGLPSQPFIYVEGKGQIEKPAAFVDLNFKITIRGADQGKANEQVQAKAAKVAALLKAYKVEDKDCTFGELTAEPAFEEGGAYPGRGKKIGFDVIRLFDVDFLDLQHIGGFVDDLLNLGDVEVTSMNPGIKGGKEVLEELWKSAVKDAHDHAEKIAGLMGMKVDSVFAISTVPFPEIEGKLLPNSGATIVTGSNIPTPVQKSGPEYRLAPVKFDESVNVIYLISPVAK
jgi:uncharacterized protein YggE